MSALTSINKRTKQLAKKHPKSKYSVLRKQASREWNAGKLSGSKRRKKKSVGKTKRRSSRRVVGAVRKRSAVNKSHKDGVDSKRVDITIGSVASHVSAAKKKLVEEIGWNEATKLTAKTAKSKRNIEKKIKAKKAMLRKLM